MVKETKERSVKGRRCEEKCRQQLVWCSLVRIVSLPMTVTAGRTWKGVASITHVCSMWVTHAGRVEILGFPKIIEWHTSISRAKSTVYLQAHD